MLHLTLQILLAVGLALALWGLASTLVRPLAPKPWELGLHHLVAWGASVNLAGVSTAIAAVPDPVITTSGNDVRVPAGLPFIMGASSLNGNVGPLTAQITSPSLRAVVNLDIEPIIAALVWGSFPEQLVRPDSPTPVVPNESLNHFANATGGGATEVYGLAWMCDGPQQQVKGPIYTIRATAAAALAANTWVNSNLTFSQVLPAGSYQVVGMRARGANLVAARLVFVGGTWRPGVPAVNAVGNVDPWYFRNGYLGVWGQFDNTTPPTVDCLGVTDNAQTIDLDIIKVK